MRTPHHTTCTRQRGPARATFNGVAYLVKHHRDLLHSEITLNEGGGGSMDKDGKRILHGIQAGEKIFQNFQLEVTNVGGHSSTPVKNNAIYHLADGLSRLGKFEFPFALSEITRTFFERRAALEPPASVSTTAVDMRAILKDPPDRDALTRLYAASAYYNAAVRQEQTEPYLLGCLRSSVHIIRCLARMKRSSLHASPFVTNWEKQFSARY